MASSVSAGVLGGVVYQPVDVVVVREEVEEREVGRGRVRVRWGDGVGVDVVEREDQVLDLLGVGRGEEGA